MRTQHEWEKRNSRLKALFERYKGIFDTVSDALVVRDCKGSVMEMNPAALKLYGFGSYEEAVENDLFLQTNFSLFEASTNKPLRLEELPYMRGLKGEIIKDYEVRALRKKDNKESYLSYSVAPVKDEHGSVQFVVVSIKDITEKKNAENALQHSVERFGLLAETASGLLQTTDPQSLIETLCRRVMEHLDCHVFFNFLVDGKSGKLHLNAFAGIPFEEAKKIEWLDYGVAVCGSAARDACRIVAEKIPSIADPRTELVKSYGVKAYACHPLMSEGKVIGTLSFETCSRETFSSADLSLMKAVTDQVAVAMERTRNEQALRESEERFRNLADNISQLAWMTDANGWVFWYNKRWFEYTGMTIEDVQGWGWEKVQHPEYIDEVKLRWKTALETGQPFESVFPLRSTTGEFRWFLTRALPIRDDKGTIIRWFGTNTDITERKQLEEELQHRAERLAEANRELESFSYSVSHDLRGPLRTIIGFSDILVSDIAERLDAESRDYLARIKAGAVKMNELIDDLLNLSKISRQEMTLQKVDMSSIAVSCIQELRNAAPERSVEVIIKKNLNVRADPRLLTIALNNLLGNAWKYTGKTEKARIEFGMIQSNGETIYFVRDNGAGFNMAFADKLFTPFKRLHSDKEFPGTGIGLAIVQRVIARHNGRIWAESEVGKGATFYFALGS